MSGTVALAAPTRSRRRFLRRGRAPLALPACLFLLAFFIVPLLLNAGRSVSTDGGSLSAARYLSLILDPYYLGVIATTFKVSLIVSLVCIIAGYPIAYMLAYHSGRFAAAMVLVLVAPLFTSTIMRVFGWQVILARRGLLNSVFLDLHIVSRPVGWLQTPIAVYLAMIHVLVPFAVLSIAAVLQGIDPKLKEAAYSMGVGPFRVFLFILLPLSLEGVATGTVITFLLASGAFVPMLLLGNGTVVTLPVLIYQRVALRSDFRYASAMANILMLVTLAILLVQLRFLRRRGVR